MPLTLEQKAERRFNRMLDTCKTKQIGTYNKETAKIFQEMIRAEVAIEKEQLVFNGLFDKTTWMSYPAGVCGCVTCGRSYAWKGTNELDTGHYVPGRRPPNLLLDERNAQPQCTYCNTTGGGMGAEYHAFMLDNYGQDVVDELRGMRNGKWWEELDRLSKQEWAVRKRMEFQDRLNAAVKKLEAKE